MRPPGRLIASGRDADVFEYGDGLVLRRSRDGRSIEGEARTMEYLRGEGYPVPRVDEISDDGRELAMERVDGPSLLDAVARAPWRIRHYADVLADLHRTLHELAAPDFLPRAPVGSGDRVVHLDLHPLNVLVGTNGPVVIDWSNAAIGDPAVDVGVAWILTTAGEIRGGTAVQRLLGAARSVFVNRFLGGFDRRAIAGQLRGIVEWKVHDPHMSEGEISAMWRVVERAESSA